jgi:hypothetical protein
MAVERVIPSVLMLCTECDATVVITVMFLTRLRWEARGWVCFESGFGLCIWSLHSGNVYSAPHTHTSMHAFTRAHTHTHPHKHTHTPMQTRTQSHTQTHTHTHTHTNTHTPHTHPHIQRHKHALAHTHRRTQTHTWQARKQTHARYDYRYKIDSCQKNGQKNAEESRSFKPNHQSICPLPSPCVSPPFRTDAFHTPVINREDEFTKLIREETREIDQKVPIIQPRSRYPHSAVHSLMADRWLRHFKQITSKV